MGTQNIDLRDQSRQTFVLDWSLRLQLPRTHHPRSPLILASKAIMLVVPQSKEDVLAVLNLSVQFSISQMVTRNQSFLFLLLSFVLLFCVMFWFVICTQQILLNILGRGFQKKPLWGPLSRTNNPGHLIPDGSGASVNSSNSRSQEDFGILALAATQTYDHWRIF